MSATSRSCTSNIADTLSVSFLGSFKDSAARNRKRVVALHGTAGVDRFGLHLDGDKGFATVENFEYAKDGVFALSFWMTKEACSKGEPRAHSFCCCSDFNIRNRRLGCRDHNIVLCLPTGAYEYLYSHSQTTQDIVDVRSNSNINMYLYCSQRQSTTLRTILRGSGKDATFASFDYSARRVPSIRSCLLCQVLLKDTTNKKRKHSFKDTYRDGRNTPH